MFNSENYWSDIDSRLVNLVSEGFVKLPSLAGFFDLEKLADSISHDMVGKNFAELNPQHEAFLKILEIERFLTPKLFKIGRDNFKYTGDLDDQYHIARRVEPGNSKEMYRAHFDSHLFTMVLPIKIPEVLDDGSFGELIYFPRARKSPTNELSNFLGKAYFKRFASEAGINKLSEHKVMICESFRNYEPLLFLGNSTLHTNKQVSLHCSDYRMTLLAHFFDPSPKYGVGNIMRLLRKR